ncbi:MAG: hypothetical protein SF052_07900 [Bacteroidia bacterium]|nr:hypothetical protein [Bacteroidia bacterium]
MKFIIYVFLFLLNSPTLFAQSTLRSISSNERTPSSPVSYESAHDFELQEQLKQKELNQLIRDYGLAPDSQKKVIQEKMSQTLFDLFDLGLKDMEGKAQRLSEELESMENTPQFRTRSQDIQTLQDALKKVNTSIEFRKANREKIVNKRLSEIVAAN